MALFRIISTIIVIVIVVLVLVLRLLLKRSGAQSLQNARGLQVLDLRERGALLIRLLIRRTPAIATYV